MTVLELFSGAATKAGIIEPTQTPSGPMQAFIGSRFREMIRTWSGIRNRLFFVAGVQYPTAAGVGAYLIGPGAGAAPNFDTTLNPAYTRPNLVQTAQYLVGTARRWPLRILTLPGWQDLQTRNLQDPDGPTDLFYDFNHPIATINLAPKPAGVGVLFMSQWNPLPVFQDNQMQLIVEEYYPDDYLTPLTSGLAIQLCGPYRRPVGQDLLGIFQASMTAVENKNQLKLTGAMTPLSGPTIGDASALSAPPGQQLPGPPGG